MDAGHSHITVVLDCSGSMQAIGADAIRGFNQFLRDQQALLSGDHLAACPKTNGHPTAVRLRRTHRKTPHPRWWILIVVTKKNNRRGSEPLLELSKARNWMENPGGPRVAVTDPLLGADIQVGPGPAAAG